MRANTSSEKPINNASDNGEIDHLIYKNLLASTKAIRWKIDWFAMKFSYIGLQIGSLLGWSAKANFFFGVMPLNAILGRS